MNSSRHLALVVVLALAAVPRIVWYRSHQPDLPPDSYGYLNVAREWRGERAPLRGWDDRSQLPWDNQAARTPGYPLFLNLVFALASHSPSPESALVEPRRLLVPGTPVRERHFRHLQADENVRAVQAAQHVLGVAATGLAYLTMLLWTTNTLASVVGALAAVGWNPVWIMTYEPSLMGEILSGVLLLLLVWLVSQPRLSVIRDHLAAAICGVAVVVRPAMVFSVLPLLAILAWRRRQHDARALAVFAAPALLVVLLVANNGLRYGYWGISSITGVTLLSHASRHPEGLREPFTHLAARIRGNQFGGQVLLYARYVEDARPYLEASREIDRAAVAFIVDHPRWYLGSVADAMIDFFSPPLRLVAGASNLVRQRAPALWLSVSGVYVLVMVAGFIAVFMRVPPVVKVGPVVFLLSAIGTSLMAHTENRRFAAPIVPLVMMSGVTALDSIRRRARGAQA